MKYLVAVYDQLQNVQEHLGTRRWDRNVHFNVNLMTFQLTLKFWSWKLFY